MKENIIGREEQMTLLENYIYKRECEERAEYDKYNCDTDVTCAGTIRLSAGFNLFH